MYANDRANNYDRRYIATENNGDFTIAGFGTGQWAKHLVVNSSGRVGIGSNNPNSQLEIKNTDGSTGIELHREFAGDVSSDTNSGRIDFTLSDTATSNQVIARISPQGSAGTGDAFAGNLRFFIADSSGTPTSRMHIDSNGNVGIGTNNPDTTLHITGDFDNSSSKAGNNADKGLTITSSASGSTSYAKDNEFGIVFAASDGTSGDAPTAGIMTIPVQAGSYVGGHLVFQTHTSSDSTLLERMRIDSSGNLLVGTTDNQPYDNTSGVGIALRSTGAIYNAIDGGTPLVLNRMTNDGTIAQFRKDGVVVGSIGVTSSDQFWIARATGNQGIKFKNSALMPSQNNGLDYDNAQDLGSSSVRWKDLYLSGGVNFGSTGGSVTSKTLDDYEEGTWTPTLDFGGGTTGISYSTRSAKYTKIGNVVYFSFRIYLSSKGSSTGAAHISGFPFNVGGMPTGGVFQIIPARGWLSFSDEPMYVYFVNGSTRMPLYYNDWDGTANGAASENNFANNTEFELTAFYFV
jgi:hypothetical protein